MAKIIDFDGEMLKRFRSFAEEYLVIPETIETNPTLLIAILIDKKVFTLDELRRELIYRKIIFPENVFRNALEVVKRFERSRESEAQMND